METTPEIHQSSSHPPEPEPVSWKEAVLAGTPALIFPVIYLLSALVYRLLPPTSQNVFNIVSTLLSFSLLIVGVLWAWKSGWPRWSGGWIAWGWVVLLVPPGLFLQYLGQPIGYALSEFYLGVILFTVIALLLYCLMCKDPIKGILAALPLMNLFWLPHLEFVPELRKGIVLLTTWLLIALVSVLILKLGKPRYAVVLALLATFVVAFPYTIAANYLRVYGPGAPPEVIAHQADFGDLTYYFAPALICGWALLLGPLLASELKKLSERSGNKGRIGFRLAISGLVLTLVGNLMAMWLYNGGISRLWFPLYNMPGWRGIVNFMYYLMRVAPPGVAGLAYLGMGLYLIGSIQVVSASRQARMAPSILVSILIVLIPIFLPMLAMYPSWFGMVTAPPLAPFGFLHLERFKYLAYLIGLIILGVAGWLAVKLSQKEIDIP